MSRRELRCAEAEWRRTDHAPLRRRTLTRRPWWRRLLDALLR
ncbi:MAG: hypothetical protein Q4G62_07145 [Pseudomonadota bacterium]|nr:hypothetical protein [Pseudomonadota bacterium]